MADSGDRDGRDDPADSDGPDDRVCRGGPDDRVCQDATAEVADERAAAPGATVEVAAVRAAAPGATAEVQDVTAEDSDAPDDRDAAAVPGVQVCRGDPDAAEAPGVRAFPDARAAARDATAVERVATAVERVATGAVPDDSDDRDAAVARAVRVSRGDPDDPVARVFRDDLHRHHGGEDRRRRMP